MKGNASDLWKIVDIPNGHDGCNLSGIRCNFRLPRSIFRLVNHINGNTNQLKSLYHTHAQRHASAVKQSNPTPRFMWAILGTSTQHRNRPVSRLIKVNIPRESPGTSLLGVIRTFRECSTCTNSVCSQMLQLHYYWSTIRLLQCQWGKLKKCASIDILWLSDTATEIWVKTGSGNGILPDGTKSLPELMLTSHQWGSVAFNWEQFHGNWPSHYSVLWVWKLGFLN